MDAGSGLEVEHSCLPDECIGLTLMWRTLVPDQVLRLGEGTWKTLLMGKRKKSANERVVSLRLGLSRSWNSTNAVRGQNRS